MATKLVNDKLYSIENKDEFLKYLVKMNGDVKELAGKFSSITYTKKFLNCTKIKFLRKAMIKNDFVISNSEYENILRQKNFLIK